VQDESKLIAQWIRWDGSDAAFQAYDNLLWSAYSVQVGVRSEVKGEVELPYFLLFLLFYLDNLVRFFVCACCDVV
jgi:hypothetical protein